MQKLLKNSKLIAFAFILLASVILFFIFANRPLIKPAKSFGSYLPENAQIDSARDVSILPTQGNEFYILVNSSGKTSVCTFNTETNGCKFHCFLNFGYCAVKSFGRDLFIVKSQENNSNGKYQTTVYVYTLIGEEFTKSREISLPLGIKITNATSFEIIDNSLIFIDELDRSKIIKYDYVTENVSEFSHNGSEFHSLTLNTSKDILYTLTNNGKLVIFDLGNEIIEGIEAYICPDTSFKFLKDELIVSESGTLYTVKDGEITKNFKIERQFDENMTGIFCCNELGKKYILSVYNNSTIHCFDIDTYQKKSNPDKEIGTEGGKIFGLGFSENSAIILFKDDKGVNIKVISDEDLKDIENEEEQKQDVENDLYIISFEKKRIIIKKGISTVNEFKDNFEFGGYIVSSFKNYAGKEISGAEKIGTGSTVIFAKGDNSLEFKIIVLSDITGEGNLNSKDLTALYNYLLGKTELTEEVLKIAADLNMDGKVDTLDLLAIEKILNGSVDDINKLKVSNTSAKFNTPAKTDNIKASKVGGNKVKATTNKENIVKRQGNIVSNITDGQFKTYGIPCENFLVNNNVGLNVDFLAKLHEPLDFKIPKDGSPKVLVMHTHTSESYVDTNFRSFNNSLNVVRVGDSICETLEKNGVKTIHNANYHDTPIFPGCYDRSAETVKKILSENPSIKVVLDIHRDSISSKNGKKIKPTVNINGKNAAQIMILSSCDRDSNLDHPNWEKNLSFALKLQKEIESLYPGLTRSLFFTVGRFNQHLTTGSTLIEIGSEVNTLDEAIYSGELVGKSLSSLLCKL